MSVGPLILEFVTFKNFSITSKEMPFIFVPWKAIALDA